MNRKSERTAFTSGRHRYANHRDSFTKVTYLSHISPLVWDIATIDMLDHEELGVRRTSRAHVEQSKPGNEGARMDKEMLILC